MNYRFIKNTLATYRNKQRRNDHLYVQKISNNPILALVVKYDYVSTFNQVILPYNVILYF